MKTITAFEEAKRTGAKFSEAGINRTLFTAYEDSKNAGNDLLDFAGVIWDEDVEPIVETLRANGIARFTVSSNFPGLLPTLAAFEKRGCKLEGLTETHANYVDWRTGKHEPILAVSVRVN